MAEKGEKKRGKMALPEEAQEHLHAARREWRASVETLLPPDFMKHRRAARRELLLAARSLIDSALERMEKREES